MKVRSNRIALAIVLLYAGAGVWAQSVPDMPLGDVARNVRKAKVTTKPAELSVDNDNFSKLMEEAASRRMSKMVPQLSLGLGFGNGPTPPSSSFGLPDVNCSLSYTARGLKLTDIFAGGTSTTAPLDPAKDDKAKNANDDKATKNGGVSYVPPAELAKLEGPAAIVGDSLQLSVYNGTAWNIEEITVSLTLVRRRSSTAKVYSGTGLASVSVVEASVMQRGAVPIAIKRSDTTLLYHFKGAAAPNSKATFQLPLGVTLGPDQEWHWGILEAKGTLAKN